MWSWWDIIHVGLSNSSVRYSLFKKLDCLSSWSHIFFSDVLQINSLWLILANLHICLWHIQQVLDLFEINLDHRNLDSELNVRRLFAYSAEHVWYYSWQDTLFYIVIVVRTDTCVSFPWWGLSICKYGAVKSFEGSLYHVFADFFVHLLLGWFFVEDSIISKFVLGLFILYLDCLLR